MSDARGDGRIDRFVGNPNCPDLAERDNVSKIFFAGYFGQNAQPILMRVEFAHSNQVLREPHIFAESPPRQNLFSGSSVAALMFGAHDARFAQYTRDVTQDSSLAEAIECARGFVEACSTDMARSIDPACMGIGGHIHVATVTPPGVFQWVIEPTPAAAIPQNRDWS